MSHPAPFAIRFVAHLALTFLVTGLLVTVLAGMLPSPVGTLVAAFVGVFCRAGCRISDRAQPSPPCSTGPCARERSLVTAVALLATLLLHGAVLIALFWNSEIVGGSWAGTTPRELADLIAIGLTIVFLPPWAAAYLGGRMAVGRPMQQT